MFASTEKIIERSSYALNNCSAYSIDSYFTDPSMFFHRFTDLLKQGCGVGFDCEPILVLLTFQPLKKTVKHVIVDSREGWCESIRVLMDSYLKENQPTVMFDY